MAISVTWGTKVINVPKADMTLIQSDPTEIRELNLNTFRLTLKDLEDDEEGMPFVDTHSHNTEVTVGGVTLARVLEIINGYTVTFEDGQYAVNLVGANSNVADVTNVNQVSVRSGNSAGLITNAAIEYGEFDGAVHIDVTSGTTGTIYPNGTPRQPVDNLADAKLIASVRGFDTIQAVGDLTFASGDDISNLTVAGQDPHNSALTFQSGCITANTLIYAATVTGVLNGMGHMADCHIGDITGVEGEIHTSILVGDITIAGSGTVQFLDCHSGVPGNLTPCINMGGSGRGLGFRGYNGGIKIINKSGSESASLDINSGQIIIDSTVTNGTIVCRGVGKLTDNSTGTTNVESIAFVSNTAAAEELLTIDWTTLSGPAASSVMNMLRSQANVTVTDTTMTVYEEDGLTVAWTATVTKDGTGAIISVIKD